ncbi:MAG TPA: hypothetical protein DCL77_19805 [Prolixibacteraceae bacterium]|nr:hypothetical protein [Prolixibacteraceae bacterium]
MALLISIKSIETYYKKPAIVLYLAKNTIGGSGGVDGQILRTPIHLMNIQQHAKTLWVKTQTTQKAKSFDQ